MKETTSALDATARVIEIVRSGASRYVEFASVSTGAVNIAFQRAVSVIVDILLLEIVAKDKFKKALGSAGNGESDSDGETVFFSMVV